MNEAPPPSMIEQPVPGGGEHIELTVESLEFEGLAPSAPDRVQAAFQRELTRLLQERGLPEGVRGATAATREAAALSRFDLDSPERLGAAVARSLYAELVR